jgi:hypothetical protein
MAPPQWDFVIPDLLLPRWFVTEVPLGIWGEMFWKWSAARAGFIQATASQEREALCEGCGVGALPRRCRREAAGSCAEE